METESKAIVEFNNVSKLFGKKIAVNNLNLKLFRGEIFVLLGPNGAGKTTTIRMFTGLLKPNSGKILVYGKDIHKNSQKMKTIIGYIPDEPFLYDKLTGLEFLCFIAEIHSIQKEIYRKKICELVKLFDMNSYINDLIENYSLGMKQRLAIASVLLYNPQIFVMDEPLVGLDPPTARLCKNILINEAKENHKLIFMSTHILSIAEELATRIGIINEGNLLTIGTIAELRDNYKTNSLEDIFIKLISTKN